MEETLDKKYKKVPNNENVIEVGGKVILSFDLRYKEYLKWRDENPDLEQQLIDDLEQEITSSDLRSITFNLFNSLGTMPVNNFLDDIRKLTGEKKSIISKLGIRIGAKFIFMPNLMKKNAKV